MLLLSIVYQDFASRTIHVALPIFIFILALAVNYKSLTLYVFDILYNLSFIAINLLSLVIYFSLKSKKLVNPIDNSIGLGDIVFFVAITPLFNTKSFILFFIIGLLVTLIIHNIINLFKEIKTVPLAGYLGGFLAINLLIRDVFKINVFNG